MADSSQMAGLGPGGEVGTARQVRAPGRLLPGLRDIALQRRGQHPWVPAASPIVAQALCDLAPTDPSSLKCPLRRPSSGGSNSVRQLGAGPSSPLGRPDAAHRVPPCVPLTGRCSRPFAGPSVYPFVAFHLSTRVLSAWSPLCLLRAPCHFRTWQGKGNDDIHTAQSPKASLRGPRGGRSGTRLHHRDLEALRFCQLVCLLYNLMGERVLAQRADSVTARLGQRLWIRVDGPKLSLPVTGPGVPHGDLTP